MNEGVEVDVVRNDENIPELLSYDGIIISPGPGLPEDAGCLMDVISQAVGKVPILGVCLGCQAIAIHLGGQLYNLSQVRHGVESDVSHNGLGLFNDISNPFRVGLYHSWAVVSGKGDFEIIATDDNEVVMGIQNTSKQLYGVQFHPESVMTEYGQSIVQNFLAL